MPSGAHKADTGVSIGSGETETVKLRQPGAQKLSGSVTRSSTSYDVDVDWLDENDNVVESESIASGVAAGDQTTFDEPARSPRANLKISDAGSGSGDADYTAHLR